MSRPARPLAAPTSLRLREVAAAAFAQGGLEGASLNGILKRVEMGKGSFYHHFADKAALHDWVTEAMSADLLAEVRPPRLDTLTTQSFRPELSELLDRMGRIAATRPELMDLGRMFHNSDEVNAERAIARVRSTVIAWVTDSLRTGQSLGVIRQNMPIELLTAWTIASLTVIDLWVLSTTTPITARRAVSDTALANLWQLLTGEERPRT
jgi:AcrR family transcriptional regulator